MEIVVYIVVLVLLLLIIKQFSEPLHTITYFIFFFLALQALLTTVLLPFVSKLFDLFPNIPYGKQLVYSAILYFIGEKLKQMLEELEYETLGAILQTAISVVIITYWLGEIREVMEQLKPYMEWFS